MKLAIFDICGTLYRCNTLFEFVRAQSECKNIAKLLDSFPIKLLDKIPFWDIRNFLYLRALKRFDQTELELRARDFSINILPKFKRDTSHFLLNELKENGYAIALMSCAPDFIVCEIADSLAIPYFHASRYEDGKLTFNLKEKKHTLLYIYQPYSLLHVCTDNASDYLLVCQANEFTLYINKNNKRVYERFTNET